MATRRQSLRILSYNIHGCVGSDGCEDADRVLEVIRSADADVVALQEVYDDDVEDRSFLRGLERLNYASVIYGQTMRKNTGAYGNILMLRHESSSVERINLSQSGAEPRGAIRAEFDYAGQSIEVLATHLGLKSRERARQIDTLIQASECASPGLRILMGDLNEWWPASRALRKIAAKYSQVSQVNTFPSKWPLLKLDRIYVDAPGASVRFSRMESQEARIASVHLPLLAEMNLQAD